MLNQNWFQDKRFVMFEDFAESQSFFDTETKNIYVVSEEYGQKGSNIIQEITPESFSSKISLIFWHRLPNSVFCSSVNSAVVLSNRGT